MLVAGHSRIGRVKIPSCIACDRPLVEKVRRDQYVDLFSPQRPFTAAVVDKSEIARERAPVRRIKISLDGRPHERDGGLRGLGMNLQAAVKEDAEPYILRSGFKMPRPNTMNARRGITPLTDTI